MNWKEEHRKLLSDVWNELAVARTVQLTEYIRENGMVTYKEMMMDFGTNSSATIQKYLSPNVRSLFLSITSGKKIWKNGKIVSGEGERLAKMGLLGIKWFYIDVNESMCKKFKRINKKKKLESLDKSCLTRILNTSGLTREETRRLVYGDK